MAATHHSITREKYEAIKPHLKSPADDDGVMKKFHIGLTTARKIRRSKNYDEYCERTFRYHGYPKNKKKSVLYRPPSLVVDQAYLDLAEERREARAQMRMVVVVTVLPVVILGIVAIVMAFGGR